MTTLAIWTTVLICSAGVCAVLALVLRRRRLASSICFGAALVFGGLCLLAALPVDTSPPESVEPPPGLSALTQQAALPAAATDQGYVSSSACSSCHPDQHASWYRTYHRTMTQEATSQSVIPSWDNVTLESRGRTYHLFRYRDEFWVDMIDPALEMRAYINKVDVRTLRALPRRKMRIVMTTGSHLHQTYWVQNDSGTFLQFPWVYHIKQDRWVFRIDSFLAPPHDTLLFNFWNISCIACHSTGGQPRVASDTMHSRGEMGIACEACHGPGAYHVHEQELASLGASRIVDPPIDFDVVNPQKLSAAESAQVCGQCHILAERKDEPAWLVEGDPFRPGQGNFSANRRVAKVADSRNELVHTAEGLRETTRFWPDGAVRAGGREYNGLVESPCYLQGQGANQLTCISCHSMHGADPNKLVTPGMETNLACTQCHQEPRFNEQIQRHTHHAAASSGSQCYNCHMPRTSYALFHAARSHRVDNPVATRTTDGMRPNACNLCHLDRTVAWTAAQLSDLYGLPAPELADEERQIPAAVLWALRGDASQRVVAAWHLGWEPAVDASSRDWPARLLSEILVDPYGAVRYVAFESLQQLPGFSGFDFDFDAPEASRAEARERAIAIWDELQAAEDTPRAPDWLHELARDGRFEQLRSQRDDRPITVLE